MLALCVLIASFSADPTPQPQVVNTALNVWDVAAEDITGDGMREVFAVTCDELSHPLKKAVDVFSMDASGTFSATPLTTLPLAPSIGVLFFAEVDGAPPRELIAGDATGATVYHFNGTSFEVSSQPRFSSLLPSGCKELSFIKDGAVDLDNDTIEEWLIPVSPGFELRHADGSIVTLQGDVVSEIRRMNSTLITHQLPAYTPFTLNGGNPKALAFCSDEYADFWYGEHWANHQQYKIPLNVKEKWDANAKMVDINNDGFPDLAVTQTRGTVNLESVSHIYIASAPFTYPETPTTTIATKGAIAAPELLDIDGDKTREIMLISIPLGLRNFINFFIRGKLSVNIDIYQYNGKDFGKEPVFTTSTSMDAPEGREQVAYTMEDFNGDGRKDVAFGQASDKLGILVSEQGQLGASKPWVTLTLPAFGIARPFDLNNNPAKDIVIYHPSGKNSKRIEVITF
ncbi:MAG TPA: VCBS repeat-containing protein [Candidatus Hydrogenedentes bacterium]|nr:VCBS repeat-containing protein [Candidatus Hydrogenedentota bacterium]